MSHFFRMRRTALLSAVVATVGLAAPAVAQTIAPAYTGSYSLAVIGSVPGLPTPYGGVTFLDADTLLIGGAANSAPGRLYTIDVTRDAGGHITGFVGTAAVYGSVGENNDGGVTFGPGGVLFTTRYSQNELGQTRPGSTDEDTVTALTPLGIASSVGGAAFVPAGMPGAGQFKLASYNASRWYSVPLTPDGTGTFTLGAPTVNIAISGGPEGIAYVPTGSPLFPSPAVLISEYSAGVVSAYDVDGSGDPIVGTRRVFVESLSGAEGAVIDPVSGDFLFSTFGGSNRLVRVGGFVVPPAPPISITGTVTDPAAVPLAGVTMTLSGGSTATTTTAADGTYSFANLPGGGTYTVTPAIAGRAFTPVSRTFTSATTNQTADFVGRLVFTITGQVRDLNDTGVAGVTVSLSGTLNGSVITDINGYYAFSTLDIGGTYTVTPTKGSFTFNPPSQTFVNLQRDEVAGFFVAEVGSFTRYFAEGASSDFFSTRFALLNATGRPTTATVRFQLPEPQPEVVTTVALDGLQRVTIDPRALGLTNAEFSTVIESTQPIIADRTMTWNATGYGSHAETSLGRPGVTWYLAEGATIGGFDLFYLIQNATATAAQIEVRYLLPAPAAPVVRTYTVAARSRFNIWVNLEDPALAAAEMSAVITSLNQVPVIVERAMYRTIGAQQFAAGHESAAVEAPSLQWYFAEGATGPYFDLFFLIANPNDQAATVEGRYLLGDGRVITRTYSVAPNSRFNVWVDFEAPELADAALGATFVVTNGVPVIAERAMWWPGDSSTWQEGHNSFGATETGEKWGLAEGEVGGPSSVETYILLANTSNTAGVARVTLTFEDGSPQLTTDVPMAANSRANVAVAVDFPAAAGKRFGAVVESVGPTPMQLVVERAMYSNAGGVSWAAGSSALGTKLR
jgi:hypothetical protein